MHKGFFITLDGTDGSGKTTQTELLVKRLRAEGHQTEQISFPRYGEKSAALIEEYLNGAFGSAEEVGPYRAAIFYAIDRYAASPQIRQWLKDGSIVVANRYVGSNMAHQGGKIADTDARANFFAWLNDLEYNVFGIPKPDLNILLHVPAALAQKLVDKKGEREYLRGKRRDIHEDDLKHLAQAETTYLEIAQKSLADISVADKKSVWQIIECVAGDKILPANETHEMIYQTVAKRLKKMDL